jgi:hypothetical protein
MKGLTKWIILAIFLVFCVPAVSAFAISSISVDPSGSLIPGTPVTVSFKVNNAGSGPSSTDINFYTDLDKAVWTYSIIVDGVESPRPVQGGKSFAITGFELSYKTSQEVDAQITLVGVAPSVTQTMNKTIVRITGTDSNGNPLTNTQVEEDTLVINTGDVTQGIAQAKVNLQTFSSHIDEKTAMGNIDTSAAKSKYDEANQDINAAAQLPSTQYTQALNDLTSAQNAITAGETALDKAWAQSVVTDAQTPINNVDNVIAWFKGNTSTASDSQLPAIIAKRELAVGYLSTANDDITSGNFDAARSKAQDAKTTGNESYTDALAEQYKVTHGFDIVGLIGGILSSGILVIVVGIIAVVLVIVGIVVYRKRSRWDELG